MKIEAGKYYCTKDGRKVFIYCTDAPNEGYPVHGRIYNSNTACIPHSWRIDGQHFEHPSTLDLVSEWEYDKPNVRWERLPRYIKYVFYSDLRFTWVGSTHVVKPPTDNKPYWDATDDNGNIPPYYAEVAIRQSDWPEYYIGSVGNSLVKRPKSSRACDDE